MDKQVGGVLYTAEFANCDIREMIRAVILMSEKLSDI